MIIYDKNDLKLANIANLIQKRLKKEANITLIIDKDMNEFSSKIKDGVITAGAYGQLLDACGRYLRNQKIEGDFHSDKEVGGIYFAAHNYNYLDEAPIDELCNYIDDLALWGMNWFKIWLDLHFFKSMKDEACQQKLKRHKAMMKHAAEIGVKTGLIMLANEAFDDSPEHLRADWTCGHDGYVYPLNDHYHLEICPSKEGGMKQIIEYRRQMLEEFNDTQPDLVSFGAYDEGGCSCSQCAPWGSNGFVRCVEALIPVVREYFPNAEFEASLWQFGTFTGNDVEFIGFKKVLEEGKLKEIKYLSSEPQYARYPFEHGMPRPIIGFPEISMFGAYPWGGFGVNPLPKLMEELWSKDGDKMVGGFPYSEGLYEDINKVIMLRLYRDNQKPEDTVREYLQYEFGLEGEMLNKVHKAVLCMEDTLPRSNPYEGDIPHRYEIKNSSQIAFIEDTIIEADKNLPEDIRKSKKWRLIYLRAVIDGELSRNDFQRNEKILEYFTEITDMCYLHKGGRCVKPDIGEAIDIGRKLTEEEQKRVAMGADITKLD